jgi:hypothetical protein
VVAETLSHLRGLRSFLALFKEENITEPGYDDVKDNDGACAYICQRAAESYYETSDKRAKQSSDYRADDEENNSRARVDTGLKSSYTKQSQTQVG